MAVISKIRSYSGLLIAIIGFGLAAFVLGDIGGLFTLGQQRDARFIREVGKINNNPISFQEFDQRYNQNLESWKQQTGITSPDNRQMFQIRQQAWDQLIREKLLEEELEKTGIDVSTEELFDLVAGSSPHPFIVQSFTNPQTGEFDPAQVRNFIQNINLMDPQTRNQWLLLEQYIKNERREEKYFNLIRNSIFVPEVFAKADHINKNTFGTIRFIAKSYNTIADSAVVLSDADIRKAYNENKHFHQQEHSVDLEYVIAPISPTDKDRKDIKSDILELKQELETEQNIERFINSVSDERFDPTYYISGSLSPEIDSIMFNSPAGTIYGPYEQNDAFIIAMLNDIQFRPDSMRASHILISYRGSMADQQQMIARSYNQAKEKADSLLDVVSRNPARIDQLAVEFSDDPTAQMNMGDLDWFRDGNMVPEFNEAVATGNIGDVLKVETDFGFHIIRITGHSRAVKKVQVAKLVRNIIPSNETYRQVRAEFSELANKARKNKDLQSAAKDMGLPVRQATQITKMETSLPGFVDAREVVRWVYFDETKEGSISQVFNFEDKFVLVKVAKVRKAGIPGLEDIRSDIERLAMREKKFEMISNKLNEAIAQNETLEKTAESLDIELHTADNIAFLATSLPGFGREPAVIGASLALDKNQISRTIKGNNAVFVVEVIEKTEAIVPDDLTATQRQLQNSLQNRVLRETAEALKKNAAIQDNRELIY